MFSVIRAKLNTPRAQITIAGVALSFGARILIEQTKELACQLDELTELHAETRTRVFGLETIEEGKRVVAPSGAATTEDLVELEEHHE